jgi:type IV pilus assembly protein PilC
MSYNYRVRDSLGNIQEGRIEAPSTDAAAQQLRKSGLVVLYLDDESDDVGLLPRWVTKNDVIYTTNQLAVMVETGITLSSALGGMVEQEENPTLRKVLNDLKSSVEQGDDFSNALGRYPRLFDRTYVSLVKASEATGTLGEMLDRLATYLRKEMENRAKVRAALAYPTVMLVMATGVTIFLVTFILPKFTPLFNRPGMKLPTPTVVLMTTSHYLIDYWYAWIIGCIAIVAGLLYARRTPGGRQVFDWLKINTPIIGPMYRKVAISRSVRTLGTMVASGVPLLESLQLSAEVSGNVFYERLWKEVQDEVTTGNQIYEALARNRLFPRMLVQMIRAGEETGRLDDVLAKLSDYYDQEVETSLKAVTSMIEPLMITVMGVVVGGIGMAIMLPIFSLSSNPH